MQTAQAFDQRAGSPDHHRGGHRELAEWRAMVDRLDGFLDGPLRRPRPSRQPSRRSRSPCARAAPRSRLTTFWYDCRPGQPLVVADDVVIAAGEQVLVTGPSGAGKTTLFRAIAGIWPFGQGAISISAGAKVLILPQQPYFPVATLAAALAYPARA